MIPVNQPTNDFNFPMSEVFTEAMVAYMKNPTCAEVRSVPARDIGIPKGFEAKPELVEMIRPSFQERRRTNEEMMQVIAVLEDADGKVWAYDDSNFLALYRELAPDANVSVVVIGKEPAQSKAN